MAEQKSQEQTQKQEKKGKPETRLVSEVRLIRILSKDIPGNKKLYVGIQAIRGVSWSFANAVCKKLNLDKSKRIDELSEEEIKKISEFIKNPSLPSFLVNRRKDYDTGKDKHLHGADLDLQKEFDIKRLKKIKSYRGIRHMAGQPVRGQRTKSHFRSNRKKTGAVGVKIKKSEPAKTAAVKK